MDLQFALHMKNAKHYHNFFVKKQESIFRYDFNTDKSFFLDIYNLINAKKFKNLNGLEICLIILQILFKIVNLSLNGLYYFFSIITMICSIPTFNDMLQIYKKRMYFFIWQLCFICIGS